MAIARIILQDTDTGVNITQVYEPPVMVDETSDAQSMARQMVAALLNTAESEEASEEKKIIL